MNDRPAPPPTPDEEVSPTLAGDGTRTRAGGTYGDFAPSAGKRQAVRTPPGVEPPESRTPQTPVDPYPTR